MTREEAIDIIKKYDIHGCGYCHQGGNEIEEAFDMAIKALEQEPCEDTISRSSLLGKLDDCYKEKIKVASDNMEEIDFIHPKKIVGKLISVEVLDKIRAEIADLDDAEYEYEGYYKAVNDVLQIIDKYKA